MSEAFPAALSITCRFLRGALWWGLMLPPWLSPALGQGGPAGELRTVAPLTLGMRPYEDYAASYAAAALGDGRVLALVHSGGWRRKLSIWEPRRQAWRDLGFPDRIELWPGETLPVLKDGRVFFGVASWQPATDVTQPGLLFWNSATGMWETHAAPVRMRTGYSVSQVGSGGLLLLGGSHKEGPISERNAVLPNAERLEGEKVTPLTPLKVGRIGHSATPLPDGRVLVAGGCGGEGRAIRSVVLWSPVTRAWRDGPSLETARCRHAAVSLGDGRVMVAGGVDESGGALRSVEIWDTKKRAWSSAQPLLRSAGNPSAAALTNGDVLLVATPERGQIQIPFAMLWMKASGQWRPAGMKPDRPETVATGLAAQPKLLPLPDGAALVLNGGFVSRWAPLSGDSAPASLFGARGFIETPLKDGRILLSGGRQTRFGARDTFVDWAEIFDPKTGRFMLTGRMNQRRANHTAVALDDGGVFVAGGLAQAPDRDDPIDAVSEAWDPGKGRWRVLEGPRFSPGEKIHSAKIDDGRVLLFATREDKGQPVEFRAWIWNPRTDLFDAVPVGAQARRNASIAILADARVLIVGGSTPDGQRYGSAELWDAKTNRLEIADAPDTEDADDWRTFVLKSGQVLLLERYAQTHEKRSQTASKAFLREPISGKWIAIPHLPAVHVQGNGIAEMEDGTLYVETEQSGYWLPPDSTEWIAAPKPPVSGQPWGNFSPNASVSMLREVDSGAIYMDAKQKTWILYAKGYVPRSHPALVALADGRLMVAGGDATVWNLGPSRSTQIWDPKSNTWTLAADLTRALWGAHRALRLPSGRVLLVGLGDLGGERIACELWTPQSGAWSSCGDIAAERATASTRRFELGSLADGRAVLFNGASARLYDEPGNRWETAKLALHPMPEFFQGLPDGRVGYSGGPSGELWDNRSADSFDITDIVQSHRAGIGAVRFKDGRVLVSDRQMWEPKNRQWIVFRRNTANELRQWGEHLALLPDGCILAWPPLTLISADGTRFRPVPDSAADLSAANIVALPEGLIVLAGDTGRGSNPGSAFVRFKASCRGVEFFAGEVGEMPGGRRSVQITDLAAPTASAAASADEYDLAMAATSRARAMLSWWERVREALDDDARAIILAAVSVVLILVWIFLSYRFRAARRSRVSDL